MLLWFPPLVLDRVPCTATSNVFDVLSAYFFGGPLQHTVGYVLATRQRTLFLLVSFVHVFYIFLMCITLLNYFKV